MWLSDWPKRRCGNYSVICVNNFKCGQFYRIILDFLTLPTKKTRYF